MSKFLFLSSILLFLIVLGADAQNSIQFIVKDTANNGVLTGVTAAIPSLNNGGVSDDKGIATISNIPAGNYTVIFTYVGYKKKELAITIPLTNPNQPITVYLSSNASELTEVIVTSTRTNSRIEDLPQKVEVMGLEELQEENGIKPGNITSILGDLSIIHLQQTSQTTGNTVVRMQGLDSKYTQILQDGLPIYQGSLSDFGLLNIPPADIKQLEIIKGSASTLYGGGAIAGLINIISRTPPDSMETSVTLNYSTLSEANANVFNAKRWKGFGYTFFAGATRQEAQDVSGDGFSDVPQVRGYHFHPKLFFYFSPKSTLTFGYQFTSDNRTGGDITAINNNSSDSLHWYRENIITRRNIFDAQYSYKITKEQSLNFKGAAALLNSTDDNKVCFECLLNSHHLDISQQFYFGEASYLFQEEKYSLNVGFNYSYTGFKPVANDSFALNKYNYNTIGFFVQAGWHVADAIYLEAGLRSDNNSHYGNFVLPRFAVMLKPAKNLSIRLSSGAGYSIPDLYEIAGADSLFSNKPLITQAPLAEKSIGVNCDINYHLLLLNKITVQLNQAFYYTQINHAITAIPDVNYINLNNSPNPILSGGTDTYFRMNWDKLELYLGYNHTEAWMNSVGDIFFYPRNKFASTVTYEIKSWKLGIESSRIGDESIAKVDGVYEKAPNYWILAAMISKQINSHVLIVLNGENLLDERQSKYGALVILPSQNSEPIFKNVFMPIDGRVINLSVNVKF